MITAMSSVVPAERVTTESFSDIHPKEFLEAFEAMTGIKERRINSDDSFQLGMKAITPLKMSGISFDMVRAVIFLTQTPGPQTMPAFSHKIQAALGLENDVVCFDVNQACAGFPYALFIADSILSKFNVGDQCLVVIADTLGSKIPSTDRSAGLLFGNGASAFIWERQEQSRESPRFLTYTNGKAADLLSFNMATKEFRMEGEAVMMFAFSAVAKLIQSGFEFELKRGDELFLHQANLTILNRIRTKLKITDPSQSPDTIQRFGNTTSASIPLTIASHARFNPSPIPVRAVACGFGAGFSAMACNFSYVPLHICGLTVSEGQ